MYQKELLALKKAGRFREREIIDCSLLDFASNDYLGLSLRKKSIKNASKKLQKNLYFSPKASMLVNGYSDIHKEYEEYLKTKNGFEDGIVVGSGFLANIALLESLPRRGDILILDQKYHASGVLASKLAKGCVEIFSHNNLEELEDILKNKNYKRAIVAIEGVYSMEGDIAPKEIDELCKKYGAILIVDEAHSSGVIGENLLGWFDFHNISIDSYHIKLGTLSKAYGSYGAYILGTKEIVSFLENRAKPIIYSTAPSLFDLLLAFENSLYIDKNHKILRKKIEERVAIASNIFNKNFSTPILPLKLKSTKSLLEYRESLSDLNIAVGIIRPPTVRSAIFRVVLNTKYSKNTIKDKLQKIKDLI